MRIALAATFVFAALWFVALRPKPVDEAVDGPLPTAAQPAERSTPQTAKAEPKADATPAAKPAAAERRPAAKQAAAPKLSGSRAVLADIKAGRTVVLLFSSLNVDTDDRAVRQAVAGVNRRGGKVVVRSVRMSAIPQYEAITKGTPITGSPTVLVIDKRSQARVLTGLTTTREIDQTVARAVKVG